MKRIQILMNAMNQITTTLNQSQCDPAVQNNQKEMNSFKKQITDEFSVVMQ